MGEKGRFEGEIQLPGGSFSRLLLSSDDVEDKTLCLHSPLFSCNTPKMLCFGDFNSKITPKLTLSTVNDKITVSNSNKRRNGSGKESGHGSGNGQNQKNGMMKKNKPEMGSTIVTTSVPGHAKGRREKLGERISVLQQLVSPYGKTDTASVLHEAIGYIRFLHDQVKVLSTPYLKRLPPSPSAQQSIPDEGGANAKANSTEGLRSRGLCLIPMESMFHVANSNGADFWSSATIRSSGP